MHQTSHLYIHKPYVQVHQPYMYINVYIPDAEVRSISLRRIRLIWRLVVPSPAFIHRAHIFTNHTYTLTQHIHIPDAEVRSMSLRRIRLIWRPVEPSAAFINHSESTVGAHCLLFRKNSWHLAAQKKTVIPHL